MRPLCPRGKELCESLRDAAALPKFARFL